MTAVFAGAVRFRLLILALAAGLLTAGAVHLRNAPVDVLPEFSPPYAEIQTEALGLSADEVEQLITVPLEADLLNGVEGVHVIRSESVPGLSSITLVFAPGTDVYRARQLVEERLTQAHALPNVSRPPTLLQPLSSSNRVLLVGLSSEELTSIEQSVIARWTMRPRLMGVPGVANVSVWGMRDQQLQVQVDPARLRDRKVTLNQIVSTTGNAQVVSPLSFLEASTPGTGGFIETPQQRLQVRHLLEKIADPNELGKVPVEGTNGSLRLSDVADIKVDHQPLIGDAVVGQGAGLLLVIEKFPGASTPSVTKGVEEALETLHPGLSGMSTDTSIFRPSDYLDDAFGNLRLALIVGGILMMLALLALWLQWRALLLVVVTVPLSVVTAALVLQLLGQTFNALVVAGFAAAMAVVVDEAVAPTERVLRRLARRRPGPEQEPVSVVIREACAEVRRPLVFATAAVLLVVVPVAVVQGRPGAFLAPMVLAYALAVVAAMVVALTVTPALASLLFARGVPSGRRRSPDARTLGERYAGGLGRFSARPRNVLVATVACALLGLAVLPFLSMSLVPSFQDRNVLVRLQGLPGMSGTRMTEIATQVTRDLRAIPGVGGAAAQVGRAVTGDRVVNVSSSDVWLTVKPAADYQDTMSAIRDAVGRAPDVERAVTTYTAQKMRDVGALDSGSNTARATELSVLTGRTTPVAVRLFGQDSAVLARQAERVKAVVSAVDGVRNARIDSPPTQPTIEVEVDLEKGRQFGITPGDVRRAEATLLQGIQVGSAFEEQKVFDVVVRGTPGIRRSVEDVRNLLIDRPGGGHVRLGEVADVRMAANPSVIRREAVSRRLDVLADVRGRSVDAVAGDVEMALAKTSFPLEYHAEVLQQSTADEIGSGRLLGFAVGTAIAVFLLLQAAFQSWRLAITVFAVLPLTLVGGLVAVLASGAEVSLGALLGLLALFGLAVRQATVLVTDLQACEYEGVSDGEVTAALHRDASDRLRSVLAVTAALALLALPFAVLGPRPGLELVQPMAVVLLGGLVTFALVTLVLVPALYQHTTRRRSTGMWLRQAKDGGWQRPAQSPVGEAGRDPATP